MIEKIIEDRAYQNEAVHLCREGLRHHDHIIYTAGTGSGKTVIMAKMVRPAAEKGTQTYILTHRTRLFEQTYAAMPHKEIPIQEIKKGIKKERFYDGALINICMIETLKRRIKQGLKINPGLIIIDEAHRADFNMILKMFPKTKTIGFTASPIGKHLYENYTHLIQNTSIPQLIKDNYLTPYKAYQMQDDFSDVQLKYDRNTGESEFDIEQMYDHFNKPKLYKGVVEKYLALIPGKRTIVFNCNIKHAIEMNNQFRAAGVVSEVITSLNTEKEIDDILRAFEAGLIQVINSVDLITTGTDIPCAEALILNRAIGSLGLFLQVNGRCARIYAGKKFFICLDFGMNHERHGFWDEEREWKLEKPKKRKQKAAPCKSCPKCDALLPASALKCKYCGHEFDIKNAVLADGIMVEINRDGTASPVEPTSFKGRKLSELSVTELYELQKSKKYSSSFIWRILSNKEQIEAAIIEFAELAGYSRGWKIRQMKEGKRPFTDFVLK